MNKYYKKKNIKIEKVVVNVAIFYMMAMIMMMEDQVILFVLIVMIKKNIHFLKEKEKNKKD